MNVSHMCQSGYSNSPADTMGTHIDGRGTDSSNILVVDYISIGFISRISKPKRSPSLISAALYNPFGREKKIERGTARLGSYK